MPLYGRGQLCIFSVMPNAAPSDTRLVVLPPSSLLPLPGGSLAVTRASAGLQLMPTLDDISFEEDVSNPHNPTTDATLAPPALAALQLQVRCDALCC